MVEVVNLKDFKDKVPDIVYSCVCGSQLFFLNSSFSKDELLLECRSCGGFVNNMQVTEGEDD